jgi:hypothetical protein
MPKAPGTPGQYRVFVALLALPLSQFLVTPDAGIDDRYGTLSYRRGAWRWQVAVHDFSAESGPGDYGTEFDLSVGRNFTDRYSVLLKSAFFNAGDAPFADTRKYWLMLSADY